jgi:hypothetical protein
MQRLLDRFSECLRLPPQRIDVIAMNDRQRAPGHNHATVRAACEVRNRTFDLTSVGHVDGAGFASRQRIGLTPP